MCGQTRDPVIYSKFHRNPFKGFGTLGGQNLALPITLASRFYNSPPPWSLRAQGGEEREIDADDCDRKSPWMHMVIDRVRFRRRIHQSELILASVLNHEHRLMIRMKRYDI